MKIRLITGFVCALILFMGLAKSVHAQQYAGYTVAGTEKYRGTADTYAATNASAYLPSGIYIVFPPEEDDRDDATVPIIGSDTHTNYYTAFNMSSNPTLSISATGSGGNNFVSGSFGGFSSASFDGVFRLYFSGTPNSQIRFDYTVAAGGNSGGVLYGYGWARGTKTASCGSANFNPPVDTVWQTWDYVRDWVHVDSLNNGVDTGYGSMPGIVQLDANGSGYKDIPFALSCEASGGNHNLAGPSSGLGFAAAAASVYVGNVVYYQGELNP